MGKKIIIKGADFSENAVQREVTWFTDHCINYGSNPKRLTFSKVYGGYTKYEESDKDKIAGSVRFLIVDEEQVGKEFFIYCVPKSKAADGSLTTSDYVLLAKSTSILGINECTLKDTVDLSTNYVCLVASLTEDKAYLGAYNEPTEDSAIYIAPNRSASTVSDLTLLMDFGI